MSARRQVRERLQTAFAAKVNPDGTAKFSPALWEIIGQLFDEFLKMLIENCTAERAELRQAMAEQNADTRWLIRRKAREVLSWRQYRKYGRDARAAVQDTARTVTEAELDDLLDG